MRLSWCLRGSTWLAWFTLGWVGVVFLGGYLVVNRKRWEGLSRFQSVLICLGSCRCGQIQALTHPARFHADSQPASCMARCLIVLQVINWSEVHQGHMPAQKPPHSHQGKLLPAPETHQRHDIIQPLHKLPRDLDHQTLNHSPPTSKHRTGKIQLNITQNKRQYKSRRKRDSKKSYEKKESS